MGKEENLAELVRRILSGDERAEEELVRRYYRGVPNIIKQRIGDRPAVEDLTQQTFKIALEKIRNGDLRRPESLSGFISSIARNLAIEHARRDAQLRRNQMSLDEVGHLVDPASDQFDQLIRKQLAEIVRRLIGELKSTRDRQILFRFYIAEEDKEQICVKLGLTSLQFNQAIFRARGRFKELYKNLVDKP